jgi:hypothetical protein
MVAALPWVIFVFSQKHQINLGAGQQPFVFPKLSTGRACHASGQDHDFITLSHPIKQGIIEKVAAFSAAGRSQRWIAKELKASKSWVQCALERTEKELPMAPVAQSGERKSAIRARHGAAPFGFETLDGQLVAMASG